MDLSRSQMLLGQAAIEKLKNSSVAVFGLGGVGSFVVEGLVRSGVGKLTLVDSDTVAPSNINRQLYALSSTIGEKKTTIAKKRCLDINPECKIDDRDLFFSKDSLSLFDFSSFDYIVDAIDTVTAKILLVEIAKEYDVPIISSMGTGNKLCPTEFEVADIYSTSVCPLARVMRTELKKRGIPSLKVVYSKEKPLEPNQSLLSDNSTKRQTPGSISFVPSVAGLIIASEVVKDLCKSITRV